MRTVHEILHIDTGTGVSIHNLTDAIKAIVQRSGMQQGILCVSSRHTTTALSINEYEPRLLDDIRDWLQRLAPSNQRYRHNDIHLRDCPKDEPENAHSHLAALMLGASESIPVIQGQLALGTWQSILLFELDGPRARQVTVHLIGE